MIYNDAGQRRDVQDRQHLNLFPDDYVSDDEWRSRHDHLPRARNPALTSCQRESFQKVNRAEDPPHLRSGG